MQILIIKCKCTCGMISIKKVKVKVDPYSRFKSNWLLPNRRERWKCPTVSTDIEAATTLTSNPASTISSRWASTIDYIFKMSLLNIWKQPNKVIFSTNWRWSPLKTGTECGRTSRWPPMSSHSGWTMPQGWVCLNIFFLFLILHLYVFFVFVAFVCSPFVVFFLFLCFLVRCCCDLFAILCSSESESLHEED